MDKTAYYAIEFGTLRVVCEGDFLVRCDLISPKDAGESTAENTAFADRVYAQIAEYLAGQRQNFDLPIKLRGTDFQKRVWEALRQIPYGETRSYKDIAVQTGNPKACRAVGSAIHNNPLGIIVPCHRVIGSGGQLTGYAWGLAMKKALLTLEQDTKERQKERERT